MKTHHATPQQRESATAAGQAAARQAAPYSANPYLKSQQGLRCAWAAGYWDEIQLLEKHHARH